MASMKYKKGDIVLILDPGIGGVGSSLGRPLVGAVLKDSVEQSSEFVFFEFGANMTLYGWHTQWGQPIKINNISYIEKLLFGIEEIDLSIDLAYPIVYRG